VIIAEVLNTNKVPVSVANEKGIADKALGIVKENINS
jgi:hypothetical protein